MKKLLAVVAMAALFVTALNGCMQAPQEEPTPAEEPEEQVQEDKQDEMETQEDVEEEAEEEGLIAQIENPDNYEKAEINTFGLTPCPDYPESEEFIEEAEEGGITQFTVFDGETTDVILYMTPNEQEVDTEEFKELVNKCITGSGMTGALKAYDDNLLWGYPYCTAGVIPDPEITPEQYEEYTACMEVQDELAEYFEEEDEDVGMAL